MRRTHRSPIARPLYLASDCEPVALPSGRKSSNHIALFHVGLGDLRSSRLRRVKTSPAGTEQYSHLSRLADPAQRDCSNETARPGVDDAQGSVAEIRSHDPSSVGACRDPDRNIACAPLPIFRTCPCRRPGTRAPRRSATQKLRPSGVRAIPSGWPPTSRSRRLRPETRSSTLTVPEPIFAV